MSKGRPMRRRQVHAVDCDLDEDCTYGATALELELKGTTPLRPLAERLEDAAKVYPFLAGLLLEAAGQIRTEQER
ncbi:MAG: hypothetical protein IT181_13040 [Acidobacteria bacterium]|nr:hypothetical protein [Acidobacteriota bacterium]